MSASDERALEPKPTSLYHRAASACFAANALHMSNSPTLPPVTGSLRKPTPLPVLASESDARVQAALAANASTEASLTSLFRAIQQLGNGVGAAREANESLTLELEGLRDLLGAADEQRQILERKLAELERVLDRTRKEHTDERLFLIDQQDLFLVKLLDEQELELKQRDVDLETLRGRLAEHERRDQVALAPTLIQPSAAPAVPHWRTLEPPAASTDSELERAERAELERTAQKLAEDRERARETVARLQAQRDEAQNAVARISKERDEALHEIHRLKSELGGPRIPLSTRPPSAEIRRDSSPERAPLGLEPEARQSPPASSPAASSPTASAGGEAPKGQPISSVLRPPRSNPHASPIPSRLSPPPPRLAPLSPSLPPEELRRALTSSSSERPSPESRSGLKHKPEASTRPLIGYSLGTGSVEPELLEGAVQRSNPPPSSAKR